mmetsp:Transcript_57102/g.121356  ORF Transcript_57102/g.121356 Transcript_57102/m.121356 type:complete len:81 (+) Transcript_57102:287-529(+)
MEIGGSVALAGEHHFRKPCGDISQPTVQATGSSTSEQDGSSVSTTPTPISLHCMSDVQTQKAKADGDENQRPKQNERAEP